MRILFCYSSRMMPVVHRLYRHFSFIRIIGLILVIGCAPEEERFQPSGPPVTIAGQPSFEAYIEQSRAMIADHHPNPTPQVLAWNSPTIFTPPQHCQASPTKGILLIHGLNESAYSMRDIATHLQKHCLHVYTLLLPGHGTRPGDLITVHYQDWQDQVHAAMALIRQQVTDVYIGGFSLGGLLSLWYASHHDVQGVIALAPPLALPKKAALAPFLGRLKTWFECFPDTDIVKYESLPINAITQTYLLMREVQQNLSQDDSLLKKTNVFATFSYEDKTIASFSALTKLLHHTTPQTRKVLVLHSSRHTLPPLPADVQTLAIPKGQILDVAHVALPFSAHNPWYGAQGRYRNCLHYPLQSPEYQSCQNSQTLFLGEINKENLQQGIVARLTYNPRFQDMLTELTRMILE